eukprot:CAMPEP_0172519972 /NCGR_PEP_ID=MMETSP1066-20121228/291728_1 /TAXON_ID=671091 /ORGANISM="Coscinodiscus wailesii, Strain CCMP2513" /LENGTH=652 /DNA_ID=CAMNT_0013302647 /DNA_START=159 /DNA_END=2118 /DNA_ORIENTATION=-
MSKGDDELLTSSSLHTYADDLTPSSEQQQQQQQHRKLHGYGKWKPRIAPNVEGTTAFLRPMSGANATGVATAASVPPPPPPPPEVESAPVVTSGNYMDAISPPSSGGPPATTSYRYNPKTSRAAESAFLRPMSGANVTSAAVAVPVVEAVAVPEPEPVAPVPEPEVVAPVADSAPAVSGNYMESLSSKSSVENKPVSYSRYNPKRTPVQTTFLNTSAVAVVPPVPAPVPEPVAPVVVETAPVVESAPVAESAPAAESAPVVSTGNYMDALQPKSSSGKPASYRYNPKTAPKQSAFLKSMSGANATVAPLAEPVVESVSGSEPVVVSEPEPAAAPVTESAPVSSGNYMDALSPKSSGVKPASYRYSPKASVPKQTTFLNTLSGANATAAATPVVESAAAPEPMPVVESIAAPEPEPVVESIAAPEPEPVVESIPELEPEPAAYVAESAPATSGNYMDALSPKSASDKPASFRYNPKTAAPKESTFLNPMFGASATATTSSPEPVIESAPAPELEPTAPESSSPEPVIESAPAPELEPTAPEPQPIDTSKSPKPFFMEPVQKETSATQASESPTPTPPEITTTSTTPEPVAVTFEPAAPAKEQAFAMAIKTKPEEDTFRIPPTLVGAVVGALVGPPLLAKLMDFFSTTNTTAFF